MNNTNEGVSKHATILVLVGVMLITAPAVYDLGHKLFNDPLRMASLLAISEVSLLLWHVSHSIAKSEKQNSISRNMVWIGVAAVVIMAGLDILLGAADKKQIEVQFDKQLIGVAITVIIPILIGANIIGALSYMNADPEKALVSARREADYLIEAEAIKQTREAAKSIAAEIARMRAGDYMEQVRATTQQRLLHGEVLQGRMALAATALAAPAGPSVVQLQAAQPAATVTVEAEAPKVKG